MLERVKYSKLIGGLILFSMVFAGCVGGGSEINTANGLHKTGTIKPQTVTVYFSSSKGYMVPLTYSIGDAEDPVKLAIDKLLAGPSQDYLNRTIPEGTRLRDWCINDNTAIVDFTKEFLNVGSSADAMHAINSLCLTLGGNPAIDNVQILIEGDVIKKIYGVSAGQPLQRSCVNYFECENPEHAYKVYFTDAYAMYMIPVTFSSEDDKALPLKAMFKLISGPGKEGLTPTVWPGTRLLDLKIENGTAAVDFSKDVLGYGGGSTAENLFVKSVLLTLGQFPEVEQVQFMIEGEKMDLLPEGTDVSSPLKPPNQANMVVEGP